MRGLADFCTRTACGLDPVDPCAVSSQQDRQAKNGPGGLIRRAGIGHGGDMKDEVTVRCCLQTKEARLRRDSQLSSIIFSVCLDHSALL